ncbi:uncharacterized protein F5147DRAFT_708406 [Suillus discolor]|uniref:Mediator of RNA polymerase II transcription subunit 9 n=1 Tax=Suillus discolor TaxID=1912936 RepID=A0A9P7F2C5_9AGAM|nr:uncharacterized protein F5147DRAFT_708406 [Suillus discolor]KAG2101875.1 hypothetical protein F5147DRAFT_708406 [Suillus discolor]
MASTPEWTSLPTALFDGLLPKLAMVLELTQKAEGTATPVAKQALLHATNDFKHALTQAKDYASTLAGGDLLVQEQDSVVAMLEMLKQHKQQQLIQFALEVGSLSTIAISNVSSKMEVDSTASTPFASGGQL